MKKDKQRRMKAHPEVLTWDYQLTSGSGEEEPCDVQFYTRRPDAWKAECVKFYGEEQRKPVAFRKIPSGDQLTVENHVHINFYNTGITMIQGSNFVHWGEHEFTTLLQRLDTNQQAPAAAPQTPDIGGESQGLAAGGAAAAQQADRTVVSHHTPSARSPLQPVLMSTPNRRLRHLRDRHEVSPSGNIMMDLLHDTTFSPVSIAANGINMRQHDDNSVLMSDSDSDLSSVLDSSSDGSEGSDDSEIILTVPETQHSASLEPAVTQINVSGTASEGDFSQETASTPVAAATGRHPKEQTTGRNIDSLLASAISTPERDEHESLQLRLFQRDQELEHERGKLQALRSELKLTKHALAGKDEEIKLLQTENRSNAQQLTKSKKDLNKSLRQRQGLDNSSYHKRKQLGQLETQNSELRARNRDMTEHIDKLREELQMMTARFESVQTPQTQGRPPHMPQFQFASVASGGAQFVNVASGGARPKVQARPLPPVCNEANRGKSPYTPRHLSPTADARRNGGTRQRLDTHRQTPVLQSRSAATAPQRPVVGGDSQGLAVGGAAAQQTDRAAVSHRPSCTPAPDIGGESQGLAAGGAAGQTKHTAEPEPTKVAGKPAQSQRKAKVTVVGASNMRDLSANLQTSDVDTLTYTNPGCQLHQMAARLPSMIDRDTDIAVLHLGTNDALNSPSDSQCLCDADEALKSITRTHQHTRPDVPMFVCAVPPTRNRKAQPRVDMLNDLYRWHCARSVNLHFVDTGLSTRHLAKDGIHLTPEGKSWLASSIITATRDFRMAVPLRVV